ncbi:hypothetical protein E1A91_D08G271500v1 [Gossypium mustelinum]|uniref:DUF1218 domain-containing protein n=1 Tax=Gossypium mustelinum TaxID=34275 RepID=A0A5D2U2Q0_GOSMU|nr:hypothetical protein E1A91_D08G271500v1 [Gossypium mustelinum]
MEKNGIIICFVVILLGIISAITGFAAESTRVKTSQVTIDASGQCVYPKNSAHALGLISALMLLIAKIIINVATGCFCCRKTDQSRSSNQIKPLVFYIAFWITFVIAIGLLLIGAAFNERNKNAIVRDSMYYCRVVKPGIFAVGAILAVISLIVGILYYVTLNSKVNASLPNQGGIVMVQPQFPQENPGFVHGYTYSK